MKRSFSGFTLIEMLVVISLIALLVALLMPTLSAARDAGRTSVNLSNLRQIQLATINYAEDSKGSLPHYRFQNSLGGSTGPVWCAKLQAAKYITDPFIFWSPFRDLLFITPATRQAMQLDPVSNYTSYLNAGYAANGNGAMPHQDDILNNKVWPRRVGGYGANVLNNGCSKMPPDSKVMVYFESLVNATTSAAGLGDGYYVATLPNTANGTPQVFTVNGSAVRSYLDGHVINADPTLDIGWKPIDSRNGSWVKTGIAYSRLEPWFSMK